MWGRAGERCGESRAWSLLLSLTVPPCGQGHRIWNFPTGRPCERRDPSVSAKRSSRWRGLSLRHSSRGLFSHLRPGVMGPCVRRDDLLRDCTRPRPINVRLNSVICDSLAACGEKSDCLGDAKHVSKTPAADITQCLNRGNRDLSALGCVTGMLLQSEPRSSEVCRIKRGKISDDRTANPLRGRGRL
jgi:hypothetical protein